MRAQEYTNTTGGGDDIETYRQAGGRDRSRDGGLAGCPRSRDYFEHVTVLERDSLPQDTCHRSGTPQSKHVHGLLGGGQRALGNLFPAFEEDLVTAGAVQLRVGLDLRTEMPGYDPFPPRDLGWVSYSMSRPLKFARLSAGGGSQLRTRLGSQIREPRPKWVDSRGLGTILGAVE